MTNIENIESLEADFDLELNPGSVRGAMAEVDASKKDLWQVPIEALSPIPGFNVRVKNEAYRAHVRSIANSILKEGFMADKPLAGYVAVKDGKNYVTFYDGHCRFEAAHIAIAEGAEITQLPVVVRQAGTTMEDLTVALVRANSGKELTPYETALVCKRLIRFGWETVPIASKLGLTPQYVNALLTLASAPLDIRRMVMEDRVAARMAIEAMRSHGDKALAYLMRSERLANAMGKKRATSKFAPGRVLQKTLTKSAPVMAQTFESIRKDPAYARLSAEIREKIENVLGALEKAKQLETEGAPTESDDNAPTILSLVVTARGADCSNVEPIKRTQSEQVNRLPEPAPQKMGKEEQDYFA